MIEQDERMNPRVDNTINTNMSELIKDNSSNEGGSMPGLQEKARENSSIDDDTNSCDDEGIYEDREPWGYKALTLKQIIGQAAGGMFPNNVTTLYAFSWHGYSKMCKNAVIENKFPDFY